MGAELLQPPEPFQDSRNARRRHLLKPRLAVAAVVVAGLYILSQLDLDGVQRWSPGAGPSYRNPTSSDPSSAPESIWESIKPSTELEWHDCYSQFPGSPFKCARLTVPMDYSDPASHTCSSPKVHIALVLRPGTDGSTKSPLLINPGGPGGMGTTAALLMSPAMQTLFGDDQPILGFDPRGIGYTTPLADCWPTPPPASCDSCPEDESKGLQHRVEWLKQNAAYGFLNSTSVSLKFLNAGHRAVNKLCAERDTRLGSKSILGHASTPHVARDMISIIDAWDRWVDAEAEARGVAPPLNPTKGQLVYWGFSYGTYLGSVFASMFPDRVGRMMLDGVVDAEFYEAPYWKESLLDADKVLDLFFEFCVEKGADGCDLYRPGDTDKDVAQRFQDLLVKLENGDPITFIHPQHFYPVLIQPGLFKALTFQIMYSPARMFPSLATMLNYLYEEKYEAFSNLFGDLVQLCVLPGSLSTILNDAQRAIMCSDKRKPVDQTPEEIQADFEELASTSVFADVWMSLMIKCNGWDIYRDASPSLSSLSPYQQHMQATVNLTTSNQDNQIKTSFPLLFLSNTLDPVTPLRAAIKMSQKFASAGLLEEKSAGHCTLSTPSRCTARVIQKYILEGEVPPPPKVGKGKDIDKGEWTTCEADEKIGRSFSEAGLAEVAEAEGWDEEEWRIVDAMMTIQGALSMMPLWEVETHAGMGMGGNMDWQAFQIWGSMEALRKEGGYP